MFKSQCIFISYCISLILGRDQCAEKHFPVLNRTECFTSSDHWEDFFDNVFIRPDVLGSWFLADKNSSTASCPGSLDEKLGSVVCKYSQTRGYKSGNYNLKRQCPLGLLYGIVCSLSENCSSKEKNICKSDIENVIKACFNDRESVLSYAMGQVFSLSESSCKHLNLIYQGKESIIALTTGYVLANCVKESSNVLLKYIDSNGRLYPDVQCITGLYDNNITDNGIIMDTSQFTDDVDVSCYLEDQKIMDETIDHGICRGSYQDDIQQTISFYQRSEIWLFNKDLTSPFDPSREPDSSHQEPLNGNFVFAAVSVMGKQYKICGDNYWDHNSASVFCRGMGRQRQESWYSVGFGKVPTLPNTKHYIGGVNCTGMEDNIIWCQHNGWYDYVDQCRYDAVVLCAKSETPQLWKILVSCACILILVVMVFLYICKIVPNGKSIDQSQETETRGTFSSRVSESEPYPSAALQYSKASSFMQNFSNGFSFALSYVQNFTSWQFSEEVQPMPLVIQGEVIGRLNPIQAPHVVLLYRVCSSGDLVVCKSYMNIDGLVSEKKFLSESDHPNIVRYLNDMPPQAIQFNGTSNTMFFIEYLEDGSMDEYLARYGHDLDVENAINIIRGIIESMKFVHGMGYVHGDISSDNFFIFKNEHGLLDVKLGDFGSIYKPVDGAIVDVRSTARFTSPEHILSHGNANAFSNDIWGIGLVIWEVVSYITCKNNTKEFLDDFGYFEENAIHMERYAGSEHGLCRQNQHYALYTQLGVHNSTLITDKPNKDVMRSFYQMNYPNLSLPFIHPQTDTIFGSEFNEQFGYSVSEFIRKCLEINPRARLSLGDEMNLINIPPTLQNLGYLGGDRTSVMRRQGNYCYIL